MKILIVDLTTSNAKVIDVAAKPSVGDIMPLWYINQRVTEVAYYLGVLKESKLTDDPNVQFIVYTK